MTPARRSPRMPAQGAAPACPSHPARAAVAACAVCGRPVCDLCVGQIDYVSFCPPHFTVEEARIRARSYGLPPLPSPVTILEMLLGAWAVAGAIAPFMTWYRTRVPTQGLEQIIDETGWESGPVAALACIALLAAGVTLGIMVGIRVIRPRWIADEAVSRAAFALGVTEVVLIAIVVAIRTSGFAAGFYVAATSAALVLFLGRRMQRTPHPAR